MAKPQISSEFASEVVAAWLYQDITAPIFPDTPPEPRVVPPEVQEVVDAVNRRSVAAQWEALTEAELARPARNMEQALAKLPPSDPQRDPFRRSRMRALGASGGAAAAKSKLAKYASPEAVRAIVADIERETPGLSTRKLYAEIRRRIKLKKLDYPVLNFGGWLKRVLNN
jgi:hypothetical protein